MMTKIEAITSQNQLLSLPLQGGTKFSVQDIEGLDPVPAVLVSSPFAQIDGEQYQASRRQKRNIVLTLGYEPDYVNDDVQSLRKLLYGIFMPKTEIRLRFYQDGEPMVQIAGRIESFDSPKFTKEPTAVISIVNFNPDFFNPATILIEGNTTSSNTETTYEYAGSVETGFRFQLFVNRAMSSFTIFHRPADNTVRSLVFNTASPLAAGDILTINTVSGNKHVTLQRGSSYSSRLYDVTPKSEWVNFFPGTNKLRVFSGGAAVPFQIDYTTKYGGL